MHSVPALEESAAKQDRQPDLQRVDTDEPAAKDEAQPEASSE